MMVRGYTFDFSLSIIKQYWECIDVPKEEEEEVPEIDPMVLVITRGKVLLWPYKFRLLSSQLTFRYSILRKIAMYNWLPTTHHIVVSKSFATLLFQVGMKKKIQSREGVLYGNTLFVKKIK